MESEFIRYFATLGVGGALGGMIFYFYRKDSQALTSIWKSVAEKMMEVIEKNTESNIKLICLLENQERNAIRKSDLMELRTQIMNRRRGDSPNEETREVRTPKET